MVLWSVAVGGSMFQLVQYARVSNYHALALDLAEQGSPNSINLCPNQLSPTPLTHTALSIYRERQQRLESWSRLSILRNYGHA